MFIIAYFNSNLLFTFVILVLLLICFIASLCIYICISVTSSSTVLITTFQISHMVNIVLVLIHTFSCFLIYS